MRKNKLIYIQDHYGADGYECKRIPRNLPQDIKA